MPEINLIHETKSPWPNGTLAFSNSDDSVVASVPSNADMRAGTLVIVSKSGLAEVKTPDWGPVRAVGKIGDKWVVTGQKPRAAFLSYLLDPANGTGTQLQIPQGYHNIAASFAENVIMGRAVKRGGNDTAVWDADGKLVQVLPGAYIGQANGEFIAQESNVLTPAPFRDPIVRSVVSGNVCGLMFGGAKFSGIRASWAKSFTGEMSYADPTTVYKDARMFMVSHFSPDGRWMFGQIFRSGGQLENWVFDTQVDQFISQKDLLGIELENIVFGNDALFGLGTFKNKTGVYKVEDFDG